MYCRNCGKQIDDAAIVCPACGVPTINTNPNGQPPINNVNQGYQPNNGQQGWQQNGQPNYGQGQPAKRTNGEAGWPKLGSAISRYHA
ncbi:MAG: zinc-ribbon domain-containing protein, partial [Clostridia bacterium]|nr:zinc-ribbon domain-containing protein [Clostridia bacterium]